MIIDDSLFSRARSKKVELLSRVYDHASGKMVKGFNMLTLGWSDGYSFVPLDFEMLSTSNDKHRLMDIDERIDKRTHGYKRRKSALKTKPECVHDMVKRALDTGISVQYLLMDSWFCNEPMLDQMASLGLDVIGMLKDMKQRYLYKGKWYRLAELRQVLPKTSAGDIIGDLYVQTKHGHHVKLVFIKNRNKKRKWLVLLSTDLSICAEEIVRIYVTRWDIEVFFKATKSLLKLAKEFQGRSYDMIIAHTTIVFTRYILLQWLHRRHTDNRTIGGLFYACVDEVKSVSFIEALDSLLALFDEIKGCVSKKAKLLIECLVNNWKAALPSHIKHALCFLGCES